jgi:hypothetical protein
MCCLLKKKTTQFGKRMSYQNLAVHTLYSSMINYWYPLDCTLCICFLTNHISILTKMFVYTIGYINLPK